MKKFCNLLTILFIMFLSCECKDGEILLQPPKKTVQADVDLYINLIKSGGSFSRGDECRHIVYLRNMKENDLYVEIRYFNQLPDELTQEEKSMFKKYIDHTSESDSCVYVYQSQEDINEYIARRRRELFSTDPATSIVEKRIRAFIRYFENPEGDFLSIEDCAYIIKNMKKVIFLAGAGISAGVGVITQQQLDDICGYEKDKAVDQFTRTLIHNRKDIFDKCTSLLFDPMVKLKKTSEAHLALAKLAFFTQSQVITTNFDLFLEYAGINPYKIRKVFLDKDWNANVIEQIDAIICIGCREDNYAILGKYKSANPLGTIIAIDREQPKYLGKGDFLVQGDIQELLPRLAKLVIDDTNE